MNFKLSDKFSSIIVGITLTLSIFVGYTHVATAAGFVPCGNGTYTQNSSGNQQTVGTQDKQCTVGDLFKAVILITNFLIAFAGLIAVLMIVRAGFNMVTSMGRQVEYAKAKKSLGHAFAGLVLVLAAFLLINTLLSGPLSLGVEGGGNILTDPLKFIKGP